VLVAISVLLFYSFASTGISAAKKKQETQLNFTESEVNLRGDKL